MNKYILSSFLILSASVAFAQQSKLFIESGGSYQLSKDNEQREQFNASYLSKNSLIGANLGYQLSGHAAIGIRYAHERLKQDQNTESTFIDSRTERSYKKNLKINSFGVFYRYYFKDKETSKWNLFAELSPSFQKSKQHSEELNLRTFSNSQNSAQNFSTVTIDQEFKSLDGSVSIGSSYQLSPNWALQLSLRSIMQVQHQFGDLKVTRYRFFEQILSNNFFSVQYQF